MCLSSSLHYWHTIMQGSLQHLSLQIKQLLKREVAAQPFAYALRMPRINLLHSRIHHLIPLECDAPSLASTSSPLTYIGRRLEVNQGTTCLCSKTPSTSAICSWPTAGDNSCCMTETAYSLRSCPCPNILIRDGTPPVAKPKTVAATNTPDTKMQTGLPARLPQLRHVCVIFRTVRLECTIMP